MVKKNVKKSCTQIVRSLLVITTIFGGLIFNASNSTAEESEPKVGLVLSGGGAKGLAHIGALKVLEEAGVEVDVITGTSMGSIIGALYAIGYSPTRIEKIVEEQDWLALFDDAVSLKMLSMPEKEEDGKYVGAVPFYEGKVSLPRGLVAGQRISSFLARLVWPVHHVDDFNDFPIPFKCIATDIETGEAVALDSGYLLDAIRASMALPTIFTPVQIGDRLLVDGGLVRNLPATEARAMGADIIIGVDVNDPYRTKDDLTSMVNIMSQAASLKNAETIMHERQQCDILIIPDMSDYGLFSFNNADAIINRGEEASRQYIEQLQSLAELKKGAKSAARRFIPISGVDRLKILKIKIEGLRQASEKLVLGKLRLKTPANYTPQELDMAIERVYGSRFFESVTYRFEVADGGLNLIVRVVERIIHELKFGFHYDSDYETAIIVNETSRNLLLSGTKFISEVKLGDYPRFRTSYFYYTNWNPGFSLGVDAQWRKYDFYTYEQGRRIATYDYEVYTVDFIIQALYSNSLALGVGVQGQGARFESDVMPASGMEMDVFTRYGNIYGFLKYDTYDRSTYPRSGDYFYANVKEVTDIVSNRQFISFLKCFATMQKIIPLHRRTSLGIGATIGYLSSKMIAPEHKFYFGGLRQIDDGVLPFLGLDFMERSATNILMAKANLRLEMMYNTFLTLHLQAGKGNDVYEKLYLHGDMIVGYGIALGLLTPIGPFDIYIMGNDSDENIKAQISFGHWF